MTTDQADPRLKKVLRTMQDYHFRSSGLIQVLHSIQDLYGFLPLELIKLVSEKMHVTPSRIYGVATFYHYFRLKPSGEHTCLVCTGTACYVKGAQRILDVLKEKYGLAPGDTTPDNKLGLQTARCIGSCGLAPAVVLDNEILPKVEPERVDQAIQEKIG